VTTLSDYSNFTQPEVVALQQENQTASRALIQKMRLSVDKRLAKEISLEKFQVDRLEARELQAVLHTHHKNLITELHVRRQNKFAEQQQKRKLPTADN